MDTPSVQTGSGYAANALTESGGRAERTTPEGRSEEDVRAEARREEEKPRVGEPGHVVDVHA